ncbi:alanyl-tRNA synthetase [Cenarchaeum symbiosum A]|uniref:Alanine--tRNA ligase n=1 Tax=Cenarchaeum symbiosum (strain A) TaxID=414004 RepID=SYA_CENSY|nr:RecName: Full=Alanine--tRNA ligase; AltName: Full=Alanyl-tRNA synthetase; Short=AlaRS [Cenarchaeum symbiosum A]ABK77877.1 alanyl-tRNA synthetase [Cenarchaeum symbiosum A]
MEKQEILREFSSDPEKYYTVRLFREEGFERRACSVCGRYFWALDGRPACPEDSDDTYSFIGDPPAPRAYDYAQAWRTIEEYFVKNGHESVPRYPVVCRWRDDLYFTIASIVDFQRVMGSSVVFEFPANPLVVPQTCLRFKDLENVGVTGRHFSSFCMIGQHAVPGNGGYWKDECIDLDYGLLVRQLGIPKEEVVFVEDVWAGGGSFGPSLEYYVRGLELGNAVFTEFQGELGNHTTLDRRIIDMGAGLERFAWITTGTPTAYDCCFGPVMGRLAESLGADQDSAELAAYYTRVAVNLGRCGDLNEARRRSAQEAGISDSRMAGAIAPLGEAYMVADHIRTLIFAISDGALPSNVGGGYNLRMMLRRVAGAMERTFPGLDLDELVDLHIDYLMGTYPELDGARQDVKTILDIEASRYGDSKERMGKITAKITDRGRAPGVDELVTLYESDGITPEYLIEAGAIQEVPPEFYSRLDELHAPPPKAAGPGPELAGLADTEMLFYGEDPPEFEARVMHSSDGGVVLDRTSFYARGGGQEPDHGTIGGFRVTDVSKHGGIILHRLDGGSLAEGSTVRCIRDEKRRAGITRNHTSTHILNASARGVLGSWVWQHSAFKEEDHARLDITHHSPLSAAEVKKIEAAANGIVKEDRGVSIGYHPRGEAEQKYGFRIYQGGVVPVSTVRIVTIKGYDDEACGGTHVKSTGEVGLIRITRTKRIQDGVVRLEFVSGDAAIEHERTAAARAEGDRAAEEAKGRLQEERDAGRLKSREIIPGMLEEITGGGSAEGMEVATGPGGRRCLAAGIHDEYFHTSFGKKLVAMDPACAYCAIFEAGPTVRVLAYAGSKSGAGADEIVREVSAVLGGSGGGAAGFAQGGGKDSSKMAEAVARARVLLFGGDNT